MMSLQGFFRLCNSMANRKLQWFISK